MNLGDLTVCLDMVILNAEAARNLHFQLAAIQSQSKAVLAPAAGVLGRIEAAHKNGRGIAIAGDAALQQAQKQAETGRNNLRQSIRQLGAVMGWNEIPPAQEGGLTDG
jgi:hypothetical protein